MASLIETAVNAVTAAIQAFTSSTPLPVQLSQGNAALSATNPITATDVQFGDTISKGGTAAAPTSGSAIVSLSANALAAGRYRITVMYAVSGAAETAGLNMRLSDASGGFTSIDHPTNNGGAAGVVFGPFVHEVTVGASNTVKLTAAAAAAASTVYSGTIICKRIS